MGPAPSDLLAAGPDHNGVCTSECAEHGSLADGTALDQESDRAKAENDLPQHAGPCLDLLGGRAETGLMLEAGRFHTADFVSCQTADLLSGKTDEEELVLH
jgi:hypothetical protein